MQRGRMGPSHLVSVVASRILGLPGPDVHADVDVPPTVAGKPRRPLEVFLRPTVVEEDAVAAVEEAAVELVQLILPVQLPAGQNAVVPEDLGTRNRPVSLGRNG